MAKTKQSPKEIACQLFEAHFGQQANKVQMLALSGSDRCYYRLSNDQHTAIATLNENVAENNTYFYFTELFRKHQINVPEVFKIGKDRKSYLQQDLGAISLFDKLQKDGHTAEVKELFRASLDQLARVQWIAGRDTDFDQCFATKQFDEDAVMADLLYFKYYFADLQKHYYDRKALMDEMQRWSREIGRLQPQALMYRDFQSRNIMVHQGKVWLIDFQGSMQGPPQYDIASLLWQAKAQLPDSWKDELLTSYITSVNALPTPRVEEIYFRKGYNQLVLLRLLQVLGAYGFRGLLERKPHFLTSIYPALKHLRAFLDNNPQLPAYPELRSLLEKLTQPDQLEKFAPPPANEHTGLQIRICSFSYKKGIPEDPSPNGGGYVFDCRGLLNPGRFASYKSLSGLDEPVRNFLEEKTKMPEFMDHVFALVSLNVADYLERGFTHLSVSFGCTGGQHRSVYAASKLAEFLEKQYPVNVILTHLNSENWVKEA